MRARKAVNGQSFTDYVKQFLVPTLLPGDVLIMDNLSSHKPPARVCAVGAQSGNTEAR